MDGPTVKDVLVEAMSYVVPDVLGGVIQRLCEQEGLSVKTRLDDSKKQSLHNLVNISNVHSGLRESSR